MTLIVTGKQMNLQKQGVVEGLRLIVVSGSAIAFGTASCAIALELP